MLELRDPRLTREQSRVEQHRLYAELRTVDDLRVFMEHHVWAVWDFMALLSSLVHRLARSPVPWRPPPGSTNVQRWLHEVVLGEATDVDPRGGYVSHFELYTEAMREVGASTAAIDTFIGRLGGQSLASIVELARECHAPAPAARFIDHTMGTLANGNTVDVAASFAYGRERVIPAMFSRLLDELALDAPLFRYYLERHVEVDGDEHGPLAHRLVEELCTTPRERDRAVRAACDALRARRELWSLTLAAVRKARRP